MKTVAKTFPLSSESHLHLYAGAFTAAEADKYYHLILDYLRWQQEEIKLFGKVYPQPRLTAWFERGLSAYSKYSQAIAAQPWPKALLSFKQRVEELSGQTFNSALANYYRNGHDHMGFHADDEPILGPKPVIASVSLGAERRFVVKSKADRKTVLDLLLPSGSLLVMSGCFQEEYKHGVPKARRLTAGRINLTFRQLLSE